MRINLVKLHYEIPKPVSYVQLAQLKLKLVSEIYSKCVSYRHRTGKFLVFSERSISRLINCVDCEDIYLVGIIPSRLSRKDFLLYKSILDLEYCVNGKELRVLRPAFESVLLELRGD